MKRKKFTLRTLIVVFLVLYAAIMISKQEITTMKINNQIKDANTQLEAVNDESEKLQAGLNMAKSDIDKYREKQARERLGYIKENETPVLSKSESK